MRFIVRGRRNIWLDEIHFSWQAQYLVRLERAFSWQAQQFVTFWEIARVRNVVFFHTKCVSRMGRVRSPKRRVRDDDFLFGYLRIMLGISSNILESSFFWRKHFRQFHGKYGPKNFVAGAVMVQTNGDLTRSAHWEWWFICDAHHSWDSFAWQVQYLVKFEGTFTRSAHCKWRFICDADHSWDSFCIAGAVFGEVGGWLCLLLALEMTFHMGRGSSRRSTD